MCAPFRLLATAQDAARDSTGQPAAALTERVSRALAEETASKRLQKLADRGNAAALPWAPDIAFHLASLLGDEWIRDQKVGDSLLRWKEFDAAGAKAWLEKTEFPLSVKSRWLEALSAPGTGL